MITKQKVLGWIIIITGIAVLFGITVAIPTFLPGGMHPVITFFQAAGFVYLMAGICAAFSISMRYGVKLIRGEDNGN